MGDVRVRTSLEDLVGCRGHVEGKSTRVHGSRDGWTLIDGVGLVEH